MATEHVDDACLPASLLQRHIKQGIEMPITLAQTARTRSNDVPDTPRGQSQLNRRLPLDTPRVTRIFGKPTRFSDLRGWTVVEICSRTGS